MTIAPEVARFMAALEQTQYLPPDRLQTYQRRLLDVLLRHARTQTEFYAVRLASVFRADDSIDWERWEEVPILTRSDVQQNFAALAARTLPPAAGGATEDFTSGSTGQSLRFLVTGLQGLASDCCSERFFRWHNLDPGALTARIRSTERPEAAYPHGRAFKPWRVGDEESRAIDLAITTPVELQVEWLQRIRPQQLFSYPSNLREIARIAGAAGIDLHLDAILTVGEMVSGETRAALRTFFGSDPLDRYGSAEAGSLGLACPHSGKHHVPAEIVRVEIVDDSDNPVAPGTPGRIIATPFYGLAMPLIRYDTGDHGVLSPEPCGCGRTLPTLERILGRTRNVFHFVDGTSLWPLLVSSKVQAFVPHRQFQVVQVALDRIQYRYVPMAADQTIDIAGLTAFARKMLHPSITVEAIAVDEIKSSAAGKYEDYLCLLPTPR